MADLRGQCRAPVGPAGGLDGCQEFEPQEQDPKLCDVCGCKKGFHEKLTAPIVPEVQMIVPESLSKPAGESTAAGSSGKQRPRVSAEGAQSRADVPALKKAKLETGKGSNEPLEKEEKKEPAPPITLQKNYNACLEKYPADKYGEYHLVKGANGRWSIQCLPCKQLMAIQTNNTLSNFERHHIKEAKHAKNIEALKNAARLAEEEAAGKEQKLKEKREGLINKYAGQGKAPFFLVIGLLFPSDEVVHGGLLTRRRGGGSVLKAFSSMLSKNLSRLFQESALKILSSWSRLRL
jgi:hypothetical protein